MVPSRNMRQNDPSGARQSQCGPRGAGWVKSGCNVSPVAGLNQAPLEPPTRSPGAPLHTHPGPGDVAAVAGSLGGVGPETNLPVPGSIHLLARAFHAAAPLSDVLCTKSCILPTA